MHGCSEKTTDFVHSSQWVFIFLEKDNFRGCSSCYIPKEKSLVTTWIARRVGSRADADMVVNRKTYPHTRNPQFSVSP
jgi:hypothetical protein